MTSVSYRPEVINYMYTVDDDVLSRKWWNFLHVMQKYTKLAKFARLCFPHFTTFCDQTLHVYSLIFKMLFLGVVMDLN